jgi:PAS domain S-box-containing protein
MTFPYEAREDQAKPSMWIVRILSLGATMLLLLNLADTSAVGQAPAPVQRVLVLYSDERLLPANIIMDEAIRTAFAASTNNRVEFYSEFLDVARFPGEEEQQRQRIFFREKYRDRPPDLVIAVSGGALVFLAQHQADLFGAVPIVYCSVAGDPHPGNLSDARIAEVPIPDSVAPTLEMMLRLHPDTRQVAVISGNGPRDLQMADTFRQKIAPFGNRVAFTWLTNLSIEELRGRLSRLPAHTVVLYITMFQDAAGKTFTPRQALEAFAPASGAPIYACYDSFVGHGIVGGSMVTFEEIGRKAAQLGIRILAGEDPQAAARSESHRAVPMFDWHQLRRWNISEERLPPGSIVLFKEATYWEQHYGIILTALSLCLLEALLIVALLVQLRRRRLAEAALRESEQQMGLAANAAELGMWTWDVLRDRLWMTDKGRALFGFTSDMRLDYAALIARVHPEDRATRDAAIKRALKNQGEYAIEYRVLLPDGQVRWIAGRGRVEFAGGKALRMRGVSLNITERKQAELEAARQRTELAHRSRVTLLGELSGSLAHELNQPLGAIVTNAGAALRSLGRNNITREKFREVLEDIVADGQRAGEVIRGIKGMLRKSEGARQLVDLNEVIAQTLKLTQSDALADDRLVLTEFQPALPKVEADVVQLQQVFLNLILNAFEASKDVPKLQRRVVIRTERDSDGGVLVCVRDFGTGLPTEAPERIFEQFFSTKPEGMGMGLFISRSIVTAHRGTLRAENAKGGGAQFWLRLPGSKEIGL